MIPRAIALFNGAWGYRNIWLGSWYPWIGPFSKILSITFPALIIGLMNVEPIMRSGPGLLTVANVTSKPALDISRTR